LAKKKERIKRLGSEIRKIKNKGLQRVVAKKNKERLCKKIYIYIYWRIHGKKGNNISRKNN
jgi:hypothetical protein